MPSTKEIKKHIKSVQSTKKITSAMYLISSTKLRKAKVALEGNTAYFQALKSELGALIGAADTLANVYLDGSDDGQDAYLIITADKGLAGPYNQNIIKLAETTCGEDSRLFISGECGKRYLKPDRYHVDGDFPVSEDGPTYGYAADAADFVMHLYENGVIKSLSIIYTAPMAHGQMRAVCEKLLPVSCQDAAAADDKAEFFPDANQVLSAAIPQYIRGFIYYAFTSSFYCEQSARMAAMDYAGRNADELLSDLEMQFHHIRQGVITQEITEISASLRRKG